jgi:predicted DNA-binding ribbon-helix-helix protein
MAGSGNKRSLTIARHRTSISLEDAFWDALAELARREGKSIAQLVGEIDQRRSEGAPPRPSLSAAVRLYILERTKRRAP